MTEMLPGSTDSAARSETGLEEVHPRRLVPPGGIPRTSRIFVNRNLRMSSVGAVGFDLDYTLAHYRLWELDDLAFRLTKAKLVAKRGHPEEILSIPFDPHFVMRGLVIDRRRGNILKMDYHNYVVRAFHGRTSLSADERKRTYRMRRVRTSADAYVSVDTLFHLPEVYLYLALVDFYEARGERPDFRGLYQDVRDMIDEAHADGSIKSEIQADPARFVSPDPRLAEFLDTLHQAGKRVFLLTNSEYYYTDVLLSFLLKDSGRPWRTFFDMVSVEAGKPRFFLERDPHVRRRELPGPGAPVWEGGDVWTFEHNLGFAGDAILYWGDHTYGDILRSKKSVGWRTAMIIPELEHEIAVSERIAPQLTRLEEAVRERERIDQLIRITRSRIERLKALQEGSRERPREVRDEIERKLTDLHARLRGWEVRAQEQRRHIALLDDECNRAYNKNWGMLFREANEITRFAHQIKDFACIYTSRVSNFLHYPVDTYFRAPMDRMPHEL